MLYHGDCREILPSIDGCGLLLTDPPYLLSSGGKGHGEMRGIFDPEKYDNSGKLMEVIPFTEWMSLAYSALAEDADAYIFTNDKNLYKMLQAFFAAGFRLHNIIVWDKITKTPNRWFMKQHELIIYGWKGKARTVNDPSQSNIIRCPQKDKTSHSTEKPVSLLRALIRQSSRKGDAVLDPFVGSGSTAVAAIQEGRDIFAIELEEKWCNVAEARINEAHKQEEMF